MNFSLLTLSPLRNFSLRTKILFLPIIVLVLFVMTGAFTTWEFQRISQEMLVVTEKQAPEANAATRLLNNVLEKQKLIEYYMRTKKEDSIGAFEVLQLQSEDIIADLQPILLNNEHKKILDNYINHQSVFDDLFFSKLVPLVRESKSTILEEQVNLTSEGKLLVSEALRLQGSVWSELGKTSEAINDDINEGVSAIVIMTIIATVLGLLLAIAVTRNINQDISTAVLVANKIAEDDFNSVITVSSNDETGQLLKAFKVMQANLKERIENERVISAENARVKQALGAVTTNVMVADSNNTIVYMNESVTNMFNEAAKDIRKDLPNFNEKRLMGSNMDQFHKHPAHQQRIIDELKDTYRAQLEIGGRTFSLVATPVFGDDDERLGTAVEWQDRTAEVAVEREVESVVDSVANGDLSQRLTLQGKTGFLKNISEAINQLTTVCDTVTKDTIRVFSALARGDLTETIETEYQGAFEQLKSDANTTISKFIEVIDEIQNTSASVSTGASEISVGNQNLSQRNEEQASSLEETASSMEEMTGTVRQNADNANQANQLATAVSSQAELGGDVVGNAVKAMEEINTSSKKVADIISVIDEIAFQTNLLALNAAVEAARAGEQGRGFAVVASEVRNLAQRSAGAAKEIKELIKESVQKVSEGSELVNASGETLGEIVAGIKKVSDIVADIATASIEQASGIEQVNRAVTQLDDMTQQNAALVEQAAASSEAMKSQAQSVGELMAFFNTGVKRQNADSNDVSATRTSNTVTRNQPAAMPGIAATPKARVKPEVPPHDDEWEEF